MVPPYIDNNERWVVGVSNQMRQVRLDTKMVKLCKAKQLKLLSCHELHSLCAHHNI